MSRLAVEEEIVRIGALEQAGRVRGGDLVRWAVLALLEGYDTDDLRLLAGCPEDISFADARPTYLRSLAELRRRGMIGAEPEDYDPLLSYALTLARRTVEGRLAPRSGLAEIYVLYVDSLYALAHAGPFLELTDALEMLELGDPDYHLLAPGLTLDNADSRIIGECRVFLRFHDLGLAAPGPGEGWCPGCRDWSAPRPPSLLERLVGRVRRKPAGGPPVCARCASHDIIMPDRLESRRRIADMAGLP